MKNKRAYHLYSLRISDVQCGIEEEVGFDVSQSTFWHNLMRGGISFL